MPATPSEVLRKLVTEISSDRWDRLHELYAEDTHVRHPFATDASRDLVGRDALRKHFAHFARSGSKLRARDLILHNSTDPEVVIGEFVYDVQKPGDDQPYAMAACFVWRVRDGLVVEAHDYLDTPKPVTD